MKLISSLNICSILLLLQCTQKSHYEDQLLHLINKNVFDASQTNALTTDYLLLLDYNQLQYVTADHSSLNLNNIRHIKKLNYEMHYDRVIDTFDRIITTQQADEPLIYSEFLLEYLYASKNIFRFDNDYLQKLEQLKSLNFSNPVLELYYKIQYLIAYQEYLKFHNLSFHALSCIDYGLHLMERSKYKNSLPYLEGILYRIKGSILINEAHPGALETSILCLNHACNIFKKLNRHTDQAIALINLANNEINGKSIISPDSLIRAIEPIFDTLNPRIKNYYFLNLGYIYKDLNETEKSLDYLTQAYSQVSENTCSRAYFDVCHILAELHVDLNEPDLAGSYLTPIKKYKTCGIGLTDFTRFYELDIINDINQIKKLKYRELDFETILDPLLEKRTLAQRIFINDDEFHLDDFYTDNCSRILNEFYNEYKKVVPVKYHNLILKLISDTKKRNVNIKRRGNSFNSKTSIILTLETTIEKYLSEIDDFNETNDYSNEIYPSIFNAYNKLLDYKLTAADTIPLIEDSLMLPEYLKSRKSNLIEYLVYKEHLYQLVYDQKDLRIIKYDWNKFQNSLVTRTNENQSPTIIHYNKDLSVDIKISPDELLLISPDNTISNYPIEYVLYSRADDMPITCRPVNLNQEAFLDTTFLSSSSFSIFSFSNSLSLNDKKLKKLPELYYGYEEAEKLNSLFEGSTLISGQNFKKNSFLNSSSADILHIVTHGFSNGEKRQDCFLIARSIHDIDTIKLSDLKSIKDAPAFVCLSSCDSGTGSYVTGTGVFSISRAFLELGTQTVLKTLWKIDDQASKEFMVSFYTNWKSGISVGEALQKTKSAFKNSESEYKLPYYWAGFVLEGNPNLFLK